MYIATAADVSRYCCRVHAQTQFFCGPSQDACRDPDLAPGALQVRVERRNRVVARDAAAAPCQLECATPGAVTEAPQLMRAAAPAANRLAAIILAMSGPLDADPNDGLPVPEPVAAAAAVVHRCTDCSNGGGEQAGPSFAGVEPGNGPGNHSIRAAASRGDGLGGQSLLSAVSTTATAHVPRGEAPAPNSSDPERVCLPAPRDGLGVLWAPEHPPQAALSTSLREQSLRQRLASIIGRDPPSPDAAAEAPCATVSTSLPAIGSARAVSHNPAQLRQRTAPPLTATATPRSPRGEPTAVSGGTCSDPERALHAGSAARGTSCEVERQLRQRAARIGEDTRQSTLAGMPGGSRRTSRTVRSELLAMAPGPHPRRGLPPCLSPTPTVFATQGLQPPTAVAVRREDRQRQLHRCRQRAVLP